MSTLDRVGARPDPKYFRPGCAWEYLRGVGRNAASMYGKDLNLMQAKRNHESRTASLADKCNGGNTKTQPRITICSQLSWPRKRRLWTPRPVAGSLYTLAHRVSASARLDQDKKISRSCNRLIWIAKVFLLDQQVARSSGRGNPACTLTAIRMNQPVRRRRGHGAMRTRQRWRRDVAVAVVGVGCGWVGCGLRAAG